MTPPTYDVGNAVYLRDSAALGFLEAIRISKIERDSVGWLYHLVTSTPGDQIAPLFGDRITHQRTYSKLARESELMTYCDAIQLVKTVLEASLAKIETEIERNGCNDT